MECREGTFPTLKIYTLESPEQKYLYLYMRPTRKKNIENKGNVPAPQVVPFHGGLLCSPSDTISLGGQQYRTSQTDRQTQINRREAHHLGGVNMGERRGEEDFGLFCERSNCTFSWVFCFQHYCTCEKPACQESTANLLREASLCRLLIGSVKGRGRFLSVSGDINATSKKKRFCILQC